MGKKILIFVSFFFIISILSACAKSFSNISIIDAKIATAVDDKLMPVKITNAFPEKTSQVFCWFQWKNAKTDTKITARWYYVTDNIHILDYTFSIPRKEGSGSVSLSMPEGKILPSGSYRIDLTKRRHILKSLNFKVE